MMDKNLSLSLPVQKNHAPTSLKLVNIGPFEEAEIEVNPLTIFIGKNSVGKSFLAQVIWILITTLPEFEVLFDEAYENLLKEFDYRDPITLIYEKVREGKDASDDIKKLIKILIQSLPTGLSEGFRKRIEEVFGSVKALIRRGSREARMRIQGNSKIEFVIKYEDNSSSINCVDYKPSLEFINMLKVSIPYPRRLKITLPEENRTIYNEAIDSEEDVLRTLIPGLLYHYVEKNFNPFFYTLNTAMLPDSRAGISRILLKPYPYPRIIKGAMKIDEEFSDLFFDLSRALYEQQIKVNLKDTLLDILSELGCKVEIRGETGRPIIYLRMWNGEVIPYSEAPSGIREAVSPAIALASSRYGVIIIEEPEAHLHPRAQRLVARLIVRAANTDETFVIVTTHSDYLLSALSNHVILSGRVDKIEELGYDLLDALSPKKISAYLLKLGEGKSIVERLTIGENGIPDDEFAKVVDELIEERARIQVE